MLPILYIKSFENLLRQSGYLYDFWLWNSSQSSESRVLH